MVVSAEIWREFIDAAVLNQERARALLRANPELLESRGGLGETPLHFLAVENHVEGVRFFLAAEANANAENEFGSSVLQECASICSEHLDNVEVIRMLLAAGANPYHVSDTAPCAWHIARNSKHQLLRTAFVHIAEPRRQHEHCEICLGTLKGPPPQ